MTYASHPDYLQAYERYRTRSPETAEAEGAAWMSPHQLSVERDRSAFLARGRFATADGVTVGQLSYGSETTTRRPAHEQYVAVLAPVAGHIEVFHRGKGHIVSAGRSLAVLAPGERVDMRWAAGSEVFSLHADTGALLQTLQAMAPHADGGPLRFPVPVVDLPSGIAVYGAASLLASVFAQYKSEADIPPRITRALAGQALSAVLLGLENNYSDQIRRPARPSGSASVNMAVELIDAESSATYSVPDLARRCAVTVRGLELGFRRTLDTTPHAYLQRSRLEKARRELLAAGAGDDVTVADVAAHWGFRHAGRFAAQYRSVYGETPSQTLRS